jgi:hypothetical protein
MRNGKAALRRTIPKVRRNPRRIHGGTRVPIERSDAVPTHTVDVTTA